MATNGQTTQTLPSSATFCCGALRALVQIGRSAYGVFEYGSDAQGRPRRGHQPTIERHICTLRG